MTPTQLRALVASNIPDSQMLPAADHRAVENAIIEYAESLETKINNLTNTILSVQPKNKGTVLGLDVGGSTGNLALEAGGDFESATVVTAADGLTVFRVIMKNDMGPGQYRVEYQIKSPGDNILMNTELRHPVITLDSSVQFAFSIREAEARIQNLTIDFQVYAK